MNVSVGNQNVSNNIQNKNSNLNIKKQNVSFQKLDNFVPYIQEIHTKDVPPEVQTKVINSLIQAFDHIAKAADNFDIAIFSNGIKGNKELKLNISPIPVEEKKTKICATEAISLKDVTPEKILEALNNGKNKVQEELKKSCVVCKHKPVPQEEQAIANTKLSTDIFDIKTGRSFLREKMEDYNQAAKFAQELKTINRKIETAKATGVPSKTKERLYQQRDQLIEREELRKIFIELDKSNLPKKQVKELKQIQARRAELNVELNHLARVEKEIMG